MCRTKDVREERCACDTSEARQNRRKNAGARTSYASLVQEPVESKALPVIVKTDPFTIESVKDDIAELKTLSQDLRAAGATSDEVFTAYDKKLNAIGTGIEYLAEQKYGAPTDEQLRDEVKEASQLALINKGIMRNEMKEKQAEQDALEEKLKVHADRNTHPIMRERFAVWEEKEPEIYAAYIAVNKEAADLSSKIFGSANTEVVDAAKELLEKRNEAIQKALKDVGVVFADPETVRFSEDSHKDAVKSLKLALAYYPQSWVDASNAQHMNRELRIKRSTGRAHYSSMKAQNKFTHRTEAYVIQKPHDWKPDPHDYYESQYIDLKGEKTWTDPVSGIVHSSYGRFGDTDPKSHWVSMTYEYSKSAGVPKGDGWEKVEHYETKYVSGEGMVKTGEMVTRYRKPKTTRSRASSTYMAELTVTKDSTVFVGNDKGMRVAMHEFAHRVEATSPYVTAYEEAFLKRRAGHLSGADNSAVEPEKLTSIYEGGKKKEMGYKDNFPTHYMGKVYSGSNYKEILSMGMESVFAGTNGGLAGLNNHKPDADYKKFILGVLASSAKS